MFLMGIFTTLEEAVAYDKLSDEKLLLRVAQGDKEAFQRLYQNTDKTIYGFILSILRNPQDAEEIMQETYLKIWTSAAGYKSQGKPLDVYHCQKPLLYEVPGSEKGSRYWSF